MLDINSYFSIQNYNSYHYNIQYNYNIFKRACPTSDIYPINELYRLSNINYNKPMSTIIECANEDDLFMSTNDSIKLKSITLITVHVLICYLMYKL